MTLCFFFKQKTAYEMRISDWSSDVCSSDLDALAADIDQRTGRHLAVHHQALGIQLAEMFPGRPMGNEIGIRQQHARRILMGPENARSEKRRVGKECVSTCKSRWSPYNSKKKNNNTNISWTTRSHT